LPGSTLDPVHFIVILLLRKVNVQQRRRLAPSSGRVGTGTKYDAASTVPMPAGTFVTHFGIIKNAMKEAGVVGPPKIHVVD
jgi:hypothetical protein